MQKKKIILGMLIIGVVFAFIGYKMYNKPHVNVAESSSDITITANDLLKEFSDDETTANQKYLEKIVEVTGKVSSIKIENDKGIVALQTNDDFATILCHLSESSTQKIKDLQENDTVIVKGICTGYLMDVVLVKAEIIN